MKKNAGFTLIELVIVIIVLGILAATAVPKFINLQDDAKASAMKGAEAALHSAANIVYSKAAIDGDETESTASVSAAGTTVTIANGYPTADAAGIEEAVELSGFDAVTGTATGENTGAGLVFTADNGKSVDDLCLIYQAAAKDESYSVGSGKLTAATVCNTTEK